MSKRTHTAKSAPRRDLYAEVTGRLIAAIEADPGKPQMPWRRNSMPLWLPENAHSKNRYNGINIVSLWVAAEQRGFSSPIWATYRQWAELGCQVRKGAKSELVIFYKEFDVDPSPDDTDDDGKRRVARASYVFNAAEVDGFEHPAAPEPLGPIARIDAADRFIKATGARIEHGGDRAFYRPSTDHIQMPDESLFCGTETMSRDESYYAVELHELCHWTSHPTRCNRELGKRFGTQAYAAEELVALSGQSGCELSGQSGAT
ncbi:MAG TPA: ArdC-like ssDNA-binding domain-containing protein, partial [Hyphomicrobium sp.]|nr:ArdC-like ssDNA-binding domain-containing protein [Hyphomicrobium sp.]